MRNKLSLCRCDVGRTYPTIVGQPSGDRRYSRLKHLAFVLLFMFGSLNVWATEEDVALSEGTFANGTITWKAASNGITITQTKAASTTNVNSSYVAAPRIYKGQILSFEASGTCKITQIDIVYDGSNKGGTITAGVAISENTVTDNTSAISRTLGTANGGTHTFSSVDEGGLSAIYIQNPANASAQLRPTKITITYVGASSKTLSSVTVSGTPTKKEYSAGDEFDPAGLTVKGTYDDSSVEDITSGITWTYNPSQTLVKDQTSIGVIATVSEIASAEYNVTGLTVTEASPKITITQNEVADFAASYAEYTWTAGGVSGKLYAYKNAGMQFNPSKTGYYVYNTDPIPGRITKITMTKASGTDRSWTPYVSTTAMTSASGTALDAQTVTTSGASWDVTGSNSYFYLTVSGGATVIGSIVIEYTEDAPPAIDAPSISGDVNFVGSTTVTISHDDADHIYYTTNGGDPTTSSAEYTAPFVVNADGTTTVKAIAVKGSDVSEVASKGFTKVTALESLAALLEATTSTETAFNVVISNWVVTGVSGTRAWIADAANEKGILLYKSGHNFVAGNKLNGVVIGTKSKLYQGYPELTSLVSTDVTVTTAETVTPRTTTIAALTSGHPAEQGTVVKLENVTYSSSVLSDGVNSIAADNKLFSSLALVDGTTYDITGVVEYLDGSVVKIMPRSADDVEAKSAVVVPTAANLAALKAAERGTYILTLTNAVVTYVNGNNAFIEDATGGALIYFASHGYSAGDCLNGDYQVVTTDYQGKFEITAMEPQAGAATTTAEIPLTTVSIATLNADFAAYESKRIKIAGANVTDAISGSDRNGAINDGAALAVYAAVASTITLTADDNVDIIGYPGFHNTDQQLTVWAQADITVNEKEDPELAYDPVSETIEQGDSWSAPTLVNLHSLTISSYASNNESVATVTGEGVIALAGGLGTAVITAHFNGDDTYNAGNATYTITVEEADARNKAVSPAAFTTTSGNLNPADITFAAYQGGASTAPANYNDGIRLYQISGTNTFGGFITLTAKAGCTIDEVQITTTNTYATTVVYSVDGNETFSESESVAKSGSYTTGTGLNVSSVNILNVGTGSSGRLEIASIKVYYTGEPAAIDHYELGGTYQTAFMQNEDFNHTGLIVYAAYDALGENKVDITSMCTFSEPDMSTTGEKTIEITYNEAVVKTYEITVSADSRKVANSPATFTTVSGDMTPNDITFASNQGGASTAPANYNDGIRLYQAPSADAIGGFITLKAKKGCTIDQVKITTTNTYATTVAYSVDGNENLLGSESVAKSSDYSTPSGLNVESVNIVNKGTGSSGRLEIASIKVWYTGDALAVDHYILGGTYETTFEQNGTFDYTGLEVYASYDLGETITEPIEGFTVEADLSTAGEKKAEVYLNEVKISEYNITVTAGKENPALAYTPESATITAGDAWSAPIFSNTFNVSPITYSSDKESVATVTSEGVITLAGGYGTAVITAHFDETAEYIESEATYTITVNKPAPTPTSTVYRKVTATADITDGEYLIVYEGDATHDAAVFDGSLDNDNIDVAKKVLAVEIENDEIAGNTELDAAVFTIDVTAGSLQSASGLYIGRTANSNGMDKSTTEAYVNTFAITDGAAIITSAEGPTLRYNYANDQLRFRYYKSGQQAIQLYKKVVVEPVLDWVEVRTGLESGWYYTMCLNRAVTKVRGGSIWKVISKSDNTENPGIILEEVEMPLEAGRPYIFNATAENLEVVYSGVAVADPVNDAENNGLIGSFDERSISWGENDHNYIIYENELYKVNSDNVYVGANRAYLHMGSVPGYDQGAPAGSRRRVTMGVHGEQIATGVDQVPSDQVPSTKVLINGQLFILRGEKMYDVTGKLVK